MRKKIWRCLQSWINKNRPNTEEAHHWYYAKNTIKNFFPIFSVWKWTNLLKISWKWRKLKKIWQKSPKIWNWKKNGKNDGGRFFQHGPHPKFLRIPIKMYEPNNEKSPPFECISKFLKEPSANFFNQRSRNQHSHVNFWKFWKYGKSKE